MENFFIVIVLIASLLYKVYTNYIKEVDTAKKRNYKKRPETIINTNDKNMEHSNNENIKSIPINKSYVAIVEEQAFDVPDEVKNIREAKKLIITKDQEKAQEQLLTKQSFDLRQAVIQSAILERPYN